MRADILYLAGTRKVQNKRGITVSSQFPVIDRMQSRIREWEDVSDDRALFLRCYMMMTRNMLGSVDRAEFKDSAWVGRLLHHFADYYFDALDAYEEGRDTMPAVWRHAFTTTANPGLSTLQKVLLGINAHINYDLVFTLHDLLKPEWTLLSAPLQNARYEDHCRVNNVIGKTIDAVQDFVLEPTMPIMKYVDILLGRADELLISHLITRWREEVWLNTMRLLDVSDAQEQAVVARCVERDAFAIARYICPGESEP